MHLRRRTPAHPSTGSSLRRGAAVLAAAAVGLGLAPAASAEDAPESPTGPTGPAAPAAPIPESTTGAVASEDTVTVRLKVARRPGRPVETTSKLPRGVLGAEGVEVDRDDLVRLVRNGKRIAPGNRRLRDGDAIRVVRVDRKVAKKRVRVKPRTITRTVDHLAPGKRRVVAQGRPGVRLVKVARTFHNWQKVDTDVRRKLVRSPKPRRVQVGERYGSVAGANHLNWRALANCESSGNPRAVNPAGYYGLYQFNVGTWNSVGGRGMPHHASAAEQTYRAKLLYKQRGRSPWPHCGRLL